MKKNKKIKVLTFIVFLILLLSCSKKKEIIVENILNENIVDIPYIVDTLYKKGDVRRYGVYPNKKVNKFFLKNVLELISKGLPVHFPKGYYNTSLILKGIQNAQISFENVTLSGSLLIYDDDTIISSSINIKGNLTLLDKLFIRKSTLINFDNVRIETDTILNKNHKKNRGASIYAGSKDIHFNELLINDTGGDGTEYYQYTAASLQIHGWKNNPSNITIKNLEINNAARSALYITGNNHKIIKLKIKNFGLGSTDLLFGLEDAKPNTEKEFSGFWINRCNFCEIDSLVIDSDIGKGDYSLRLGEGKFSEPSFIYNISIKNRAKKLPILDDELTNILVKNEF